MKIRFIFTLTILSLIFSSVLPGIIQAQTRPNSKLKVEIPKLINDSDLEELCIITEQAITAGCGFGWLKAPPREILIKYWKGTLLVPHRKLIVGRLNNVIAGTLQLIFQLPNNEAQQ